MKNKVTFENGMVSSTKITYEDLFGFGKVEVKSHHNNIMPDIIDVEEIQSGDSVKVVRVTFDDNTSEKAVLSANDHYSLEDGISICVTKKLLSDKTCGCGTAVYNKIIDHKAKREKRKAAAREEALNFYAEAYARALRMVDSKNFSGENNA